MGLHRSAASEISVGDDSVTYQRSGKIRQWIQDIDAIDTSRSSVVGTELNSMTTSEDGRPTEGTTYIGSDSDLTLSKLRPDHLLPDDDMDNDDDFFVEAAQQALSKGRVAFQADDYSAAAAYLHEALTMTKGLTAKQQAACNTWELRRMLGICAFHVYDPLEAEAALLSILDHAPKNAVMDDEQRLQISEIAHFLGQTYVKVGDLEKAYRYTEYALRGRRRVLGKNHKHSYESLALMARVLNLQGNHLRAQFFADMIPEGQRSAYLPQFEALERVDSPQVLPQTVTPDPVTPLEKSRDSALQGVSHEHIASPLHDDLRPGSSISAPISTVMSDVEDATTHLSVSPPTSPESPKAHWKFRDAGAAASSPTISTRARDQYQMLPAGLDPRPMELPDLPGIVSDLPSQRRAYPPSPPQINAYTISPPHQARQELDARSLHRIETSSAEHAAGSELVTGERPSRDLGNDNPVSPKNLRPQPLRPQRPVYVSELPGDTHFSIALGPPPTAPLPWPPTRPSLPVVSPSAEQSKAPPPMYQAYSPPPVPHPVERPNIASIESNMTCTPQDQPRASFKHLPIQPEIAMQRRKTEHQPQSRKPSLMKIFRTKSAASRLVKVPQPSTIRQHNLHLTQRDLETIRNEAFNDTIIDFWQGYLEQEVIKGNAKYMLMRPVRCYFLVNEHEITPALRATLPDFQSTVHVLIPLRSPSGHWSLLLASGQDAMACHYDPHPGKNKTLAEKATKRISNSLEKPLTFLEVPDVPVLTEPKDSGVLVCFFMQYVIEKLQRTPASQKTDAKLLCKAIRGKEARKEMLRVLKAAGGVKD